MNAITELKQYAYNPTVFDRFMQVTQLKRVADMYISECLLAVANSERLQNCTPQSIITSTLRAATLGLHLDLDQAYLVPYKDQCTIITGYKGLYELGMRTREYQILHAGHMPENWTVEFDMITGEARHKQENGAPRGAVAHFTLLNGFTKTVYMTLPDIHAYASQYSRSYNEEKSPWNINEHSRGRMEVKTVFRRLMLEWGIMSPIAKQMVATEETQLPDPTLPEPEEPVEVTPALHGGASVEEHRTKEQTLKELGFDPTN